MSMNNNQTFNPLDITDYKVYDNNTLLIMRKSIDDVLQEREIYKLKLRKARKLAKCQVDLQKVVKGVNDFLGFDITVPNRAPKFTYPRFAVFYILNKEYKYTLVNIGEIYGGRDHTTILHGISVAEEYILDRNKSPEFWDIYIKIRAFIDDLLGVKQFVNI